MTATRTRVKLERLTINQAEKSEDSTLYVLNKSNPRGNVNFVVVDSGQQKVSIQVPVTFIPIDLSVFGQKQDILRNPNFRRMIGRGFLHLISSESAEEFLQEPRAEKEYNRIFDVIQPDSEGTFQAPLDASVNAAPPSSEDTISQFAQNIVLRATNEDIDDLLNELEGKRDTISRTDLQYLMDKTASSDLKAWCVEALSILKEEEEEAAAEKAASGKK